MSSYRSGSNKETRRRFKLSIFLSSHDQERNIDLYMAGSVFEDKVSDRLPGDANNGTRKEKNKLKTLCS